MREEYGKSLFDKLTNNGTEAISKEVIASLPIEDIEAMILAIVSVEDRVALDTLNNLLEEDLIRNAHIPDVGIAMPPVRCFHRWEGVGVDLCDLGGGFSIIEEGQCDKCENFCIGSWDLERYQRERE